MNALKKIKEVIAATEKDAENFYAKGNKAAGTRLRKAYQEIKNLASEGRAEVQAAKNEGK
ncbi:histone H1 [Pedobacter paludis]|uniref:Histone H1 n=1 Tax=Pedobacter paludis TaxID=2203212 RepID=A0A317F4S5_9SPHI|nr:histone H1 [Pedobacter paludis]PWS33323.1 histone H1 [Pedobacter paludis]